MRVKQSEVFICVKENAQPRQETENHMITLSYRIRQVRWTERYGIRTLRELQITTRRTLLKLSEM